MQHFCDNASVAFWQVPKARILTGWPRSCKTTLPCTVCLTSSHPTLPSIFSCPTAFPHPQWHAVCLTRLLTMATIITSRRALSCSQQFEGTFKQTQNPHLYGPNDLIPCRRRVLPEPLGNTQILLLTSVHTIPFLYKGQCCFSKKSVPVVHVQLCIAFKRKSLQCGLYCIESLTE